MPTETVRAFTARWIVLSALMGAGIFYLPYHVAVPVVPYSVSAASGFNNHFAVFMLLIGLGVATLFCLFAGSATPKPGGNEPVGQLGAGPLLLVCGVYSATFVFFWCTVGVSRWIGEAWYFMPRLYYMGHGLLPYRDFEFAYGPLMIYLPYWVGRVFGLSAEIGYALSVWGMSLAGNCILWVLIRRAHAGRWAKTAAFLCLASWYHLATSAQYTLFRFICGFAALALASAVTVGLRHRWYLLPAVYVVLTLALMAYSPEVGCTFIVGLLVYLILELRGFREFCRIAGCYLLLLAATAVISLPPNSFSTLRAFAEGGNAFPILPSPFVVLYVGSLLVVIPPLLAQGAAWLFRKEVPAGNPFGTPLTTAFAVLCVALVPAALGRADLGHVCSYGIGVFLLALLRDWPPGRLWLLYCCALVAIFQVLSITVSLHYLGATYRSALAQTALSIVERHPNSGLVSAGKSILGDTRCEALQARLRRVRDRGLESHYPELAGLGPICAPTGDPRLTAVLARHDALKPEYYSSVALFTPLQVRRKIADIESCSYLLTVAGGEPALDLPWLLCFPWLPPQRHGSQYDPWMPITAFMKSEFLPMKKLGDRWVLYSRRGVMLQRSTAGEP